MSLLVYITLPAKDDAVKFARMLVAEKAAAGVNILGPAQSVYMWEERMCEKSEWILLAQVSRPAFECFKKLVEAAHPYVVPCILGLPVESANKPFMDWIAANSLADGICE